MKFFNLVILSLLCVACGVQKQVTPKENSRVEVRTETVFLKDTVYIELPAIMEKVETHDTISIIENKYAKSEASVSNGTLVHSLATKPVREPKIIENKVIYRDSLVFVDKILTETVEAEKKLSPFKTAMLGLGEGIFFGLIGALLLWLAFMFWKLIKK